MGSFFQHTLSHTACMCACVCVPFGRRCASVVYNKIAKWKFVPGGCASSVRLLQNDLAVKVLQFNSSDAHVNFIIYDIPILGIYC